jgi:hypothetical protein
LPPNPINPADAAGQTPTIVFQSLPLMADSARSSKFRDDVQLQQTSMHIAYQLNQAG